MRTAKLDVLYDKRTDNIFVVVRRWKLEDMSKKGRNIDTFTERVDAIDTIMEYGARGMFPEGDYYEVEVIRPGFTVPQITQLADKTYRHLSKWRKSLQVSYAGAANG